MTAPDSEWMERTEADLAEIVDGLARLKDDARSLFTEPYEHGPMATEVDFWRRCRDLSERMLAERLTDECGGMILQGVCTLPYGHSGDCGLIALRCGLEIDGKPCIGKPGHLVTCREIPQ